MNNIKELIDKVENQINWISTNINNGINGPYGVNDIKKIKNDINLLSIDIKQINEHLFKELQEINSNLFFGYNQINLFSLGRITQIIRSVYFIVEKEEFWQYIHPKIKEVSLNKFNDGYYSDSVQTAMKELLDLVKKYRKSINEKEISSELKMIQATFCNGNILKFTDSSSTSLKNIQTGYERIVQGIIEVIRNPGSHSNQVISKCQSINHLFIINDLYSKIENSIKKPNNVEKINN